MYVACFRVLTKQVQSTFCLVEFVQLIIDKVMAPV